MRGTYGDESGRQKDGGDEGEGFHGDAVETGSCGDIGIDLAV